MLTLLKRFDTIQHLLQGQLTVDGLDICTNLNLSKNGNSESSIMKSKFPQFLRKEEMQYFYAPFIEEGNIALHLSVGAVQPISRLQWKFIFIHEFF